MKISYYPGCTLKTQARNLEQAALECFKVMGVEVEELPRWNCCGAVYSLADDDLIHLVAPVRDLVRVKEQGHGTVITLCSMCYNTLARANNLMKNDEEKRGTINEFMDEEIDYKGEVKVVHLLDFIRDEIGFDKLKAMVKKPLTDLKVAAYYGCTLLRPEEAAIDNMDQPKLFQQLVEALGGEAIEFPSMKDCCGSYHAITQPDIALDASHKILEDATKHGANALALVCPLCDYNLGRKQSVMLEKYEGAVEVPTYYITQLLAIALGVDTEACAFDLNRDSALNLLKEKKLA
jgi:heterodisulfide reductase subunit B